jgi:predicted  nucleic acid-binding Zn-ribbon protein
MANKDEPDSGGEEKALRDLKHAEADLRHAEEEVHQAEEELEEARKHKDEITIMVDGVDHRVRRGMWVVRDLKARLGIDQAKVLAEITPQGLKDLDDNAEIELHEKEQFMTHARSGGSS